MVLQLHLAARTLMRLWELYPWYVTNLKEEKLKFRKIKANQSNPNEGFAAPCWSDPEATLRIVSWASLICLKPWSGDYLLNLLMFRIQILTKPSLDNSKGGKPHLKAVLSWPLDPTIMICASVTLSEWNEKHVWGGDSIINQFHVLLSEPTTACLSIRHWSMSCGLDLGHYMDTRSCMLGAVLRSIQQNCAKHLTRRKTMANLLGQPLKERGKASQNNPFKGSIHQISLHQPKFECWW